MILNLKKNIGIEDDNKSLHNVLWDYLAKEHDLILLDSEVYEIIHLIDKFRSENDS